jgi:hypothetical protein
MLGQGGLVGLVSPHGRWTSVKAGERIYQPVAQTRFTGTLLELSRPLTKLAKGAAYKTRLGLPELCLTIMTISWRRQN